MAGTDDALVAQPGTLLSGAEAQIRSTGVIRSSLVKSQKIEVGKRAGSWELRRVLERSVMSPELLGPTHPIRRRLVGSPASNNAKSCFLAAAEAAGRFGLGYCSVSPGRQPPVVCWDSSAGLPCCLVFFFFLTRILGQFSGS